MYRYFMVNDILQFTDNNDMERILWIDPNYEYCYTIDILSNSLKIVIRPIEELNSWGKNKEIFIKTEDPTFKVILEEEINDENIKRRDEALDIVNFVVNDATEPDIYNPHSRRKSILKATKKFKIGEKTIYKYLRKYLQSGRIKNSLLPEFSNCGGKGKSRSSLKKLGRPRNFFYVTGERKGINIDDNIRKIFETGITRYYNTPEELSLPQVFKRIKNEFFIKTVIEDEKIVKKTLSDDQKPTLGQFLYYFHSVRDRDLKKEIVSRKSEKYYLNNCKELKSSSKFETIGAGFRYQIDSTVADVYLVNRFDRSSIIGRPVVYIATDVSSTCTTACHIALEGPNWNGVASLIYNMMEDKVEYCKKFGFEIHPDDWNIRGLPRVILADRGETIGPIAEGIIEDLGISLENTPPYFAAAKGLVEQYFDTTNEFIREYSPGTIKKQFRERGDRDYRLDAILDINQFTQLILCSIIERNKRVMSNYKLSKEMIADGVNPIPIEIWDWEINNRSGNLFTIPDERLKLGLMRKNKAIVTEGGIKFQGKLYTCEKAVSEHWFAKARTQKSWYEDICFDNRNMTHIYLINKESYRLETCKLREDYYELYENISFEEYEDLEFMNTVKVGELGDYSDQVKVDSNEIAENIISEAEKMTSKADNKKKNTKGIRENRKKEKVIYGKEQALKYGEIDNEANSEIIPNEEIDDSVKIQVRKLKEILKKVK